MSALKLVTAAATYPVSQAQAKSHLRIDHNDENTLVDLLISAATGHAERFLGRALIDQTWDLYLDAFPSGEIEIPLPPLIEVVGVFHLDSAGAEQEFEAFEVDRATNPARVYLATGGAWPTPATQLNAVRIRFRAGYLNSNSPPDSPPTNNVPDDIRCAILLYIGTLYANRETIVVGSTAVQMPWSAEQLLRPHRFHLSMA